MKTLTAPTNGRPFPTISGETPADPANEGRWKTLYRTAGLAALAVVALMPVQMAVFVMWPIPTTVTEWFQLFQDNALVGLINMDLLLIVDYVLLAGLFLGLYVALRRVAPSLAAIFVTAELIAVATYFASATAFEMLAASGQYAAAVTDLERSSAIAAGQTLVLTWQGTAFGVSYVLAGLALLLAGLVMLRGGPFGKVTAYAGVVGGAMGLVPATAGSVGLVLSLTSLIPLVIWLVGSGRTLLRLSAHMTP